MAGVALHRVGAAHDLELVRRPREARIARRPLLAGEQRQKRQAESRACTGRGHGFSFKGRAPPQGRALVSAWRTCEMTESFLRSDLPSMRYGEGAGGESLQGVRFLATVGSRIPLCVPVRRWTGEQIGGGAGPRGEPVRQLKIRIR